MSTARIPPISCADLARHLPGLIEQQEGLDDQARALADHTVERHTAKRSFDTVQNRIIAIEDMILAGTPATLADATAVLLIAASKVADARSFQDPERMLEQAERALHAVLFAVAAAAKVNLDDFAFAEYAPYTVRPDAPAARPAAGEAPA